MIEFPAIYYDGKTSARHAVSVHATGTTLRVTGEKVNLEVPLADARIEAPVPGASRAIRLAGGAVLQTHDNDALDALFPHANRLERWVHLLERRWRYALAGLVVVMLGSAWGVIYGLPLAAAIVARFVPPAAEAALGRQAMRAIDASLCAPTKLEASKQQALRAAFDTLTSGIEDAERYRLELRSCDAIGPNAFALPGATIVLTDGLVDIAQNSAQVSAVLAHEIGHVRHRHGLRQVLQAAGLAALASALVGDAASMTGLALALPTLLLQNGYSRAFEDEADGYAFRRLKEIGLSPKDFAAILTLLDDFHSKRLGIDEAPGEKRNQDYLSTHPATARRIERALSSP